MSLPVIVKIYIGDQLKAVKQFVEDQILIGQQDEAQVHLNSDNVALFHAMIEKRSKDGKDSYYLSDLGSGLETKLNERNVLESEILSGDVIDIAEFSIRFYVGFPKTATQPNFNKSHDKPKTSLEAANDRLKSIVKDPQAGVPTVNVAALVVTQPVIAEQKLNPSPEPLIQEGELSKQIGPGISQDSKNEQKTVEKSTETPIAESKTQLRDQQPPSSIDDKKSTSKVKTEEAQVQETKSKLTSNKKLEPELQKPSTSSEVLAGSLVNPNIIKPKKRTLRKTKSKYVAEEKSIESLLDMQTRGAVLEVLIVWKGRILESHHFQNIKSLSVGNDGSSDIHLNIPEKIQTHKLISFSPNPVLNLTSTMNAKIYNEGVPSTLDFPGQHSLQQGQVARVELDGENLEAIVRFVESTPTIPSGALFDFSIVETAGILLATLVSGFLAFYMSFVSENSIDPETALLDDPYRMAKIDFKPPPEFAKPPEPKAIVEDKPVVVPPAPIKKTVIQETKTTAAPVVKKQTPRPEQSKGKRGQPKETVIAEKAGQASELKANPDAKKKNGTTVNKSGGAIGTGATGANAQSKPDIKTVGLLGTLGGGGARAQIDKAYSGAGTTFGLSDKATGAAGQLDDRQGDGLGSALKDVGRGGNGKSLVGASKGINTTGRSGGQTNYGAGGIGDKGAVALVNVSGAGARISSSSISKDEIRRIIRRNKSVIQACYQRELIKNRNLGGTIGVGWTIVSGGRPINFKITRNEMGNRTVANCLVNRLKVITFPDPGNEQATVTEFPFEFVGR